MTDDQKSQTAQDVLKNLQSGYYDMTDQDTIKMLTDMETKNPYLNGQDLVTMGAKGLVDRGLNIAKVKADINQSNASAANSYASAAKDNAAAAATTDYNDQLGKLDASKGLDGFVSTDKYKELRTASKDKATFDKNFSTMLNPNDPTAAAFTPKNLSLNQADATTNSNLLSYFDLIKNGTKLESDGSTAKKGSKTAKAITLSDIISDPQFSRFNSQEIIKAYNDYNK
jgi:hypothetical protein